MKNLYQRLLLLIAGATQWELARHVRYLKVENDILRSKPPKRVLVTPKKQNRLEKFGARLGKALNDLVTIVRPDTLRRWIRDSQRTDRKRSVKVGRPRTQEQVRDLILKLTRENGWGYHPHSRQTCPSAPGKAKDAKTQISAFTLLSTKHEAASGIGPKMSDFIFV